MRAWLDGQLIDAEAPAVPVVDRGFMLGDGLFETMRVVDGVIQRRAAHRDRFAAGCNTMALPDCTAAFDAACSALAPDASGIHSLRIQVTRGSWTSMAAGSTPRVAAVLRPAGPPRARVRMQFAAARKDARDPLVRVKHMGYASTLHALRSAQAAGWDDALFLNSEGRIAEATTSNLMARRGKTIYAPGPDEGALGGTTRQAALALLRADDCSIVERLTLEQLGDCEEVWLTSTLQGAVPVVAVEDMAWPVGAFTQSLQEQLLEPES